MRFSGFIKQKCTYVILLFILSYQGYGQQLYIDILDTAHGMHYKLQEGNHYFIKLMTDTAPTKRIVKKIYNESMVVCIEQKKKEMIWDSVSFQLIDSIGFQDQHAFWKTYGVFAAVGAVAVVGSYYTLSDISSDKKRILTVLSIPLGLVIIPITAAYYLTDKMYPVDYVNTTSRYWWYVKKVKVKSKKK